MRSLHVWTVAVGLAALTGAPQAALIDRGGGMLYDTVRNITWLQDWNLLKTQFDTTGGASGDADGLVAWSTARNWATNLSFGGHDDWRLPSAKDSDGTKPAKLRGADSELGHMFYTNLGGLSAQDAFVNPAATDAQRANLALLRNLPTQNATYWTADNPELDFDQAFAFQLTNVYSQFGLGPTAGVHDAFRVTSVRYAVAVRDGDVAVAVPEPQTWALALLAMGAAVAARRRRPA